MTGSETKDVRLFDIRVVERNIKKGLITRKDQEHFLKTLPDATEKVAEATEYVPGLTAAEMNEAALASGAISIASMPVAAPSVSNGVDSYAATDDVAVAADDAAPDDEGEDDDEEEDEADDAETDDGEPPPAA